jgi:hypothetical protein
MSHTNDRYRLLHQLSAAQAIAVETIDAGGTHADAASAAGVDRTTVSRWVTKHPSFVAEINRRRRDRAIENGIKISNVTVAALGLVEEAVVAGDLAIAIRWLMRFGPAALASHEQLPVSADEVIEQRRRALPFGGELGEMLDSLDGRTTAQVCELIVEEMEASG